jgi:phosphoribosylanthranilate isomerase
VKICGITRAEDALAAVEAGAAALGFNFYPGSRRYVTPAAAAEIVRQLPAAVCRVGVFVDEPRPSIAAIVARVGLTALQFHGSESGEDCCGWSQKVIKAIRVTDRSWMAEARSYDVDLILVDALVAGHFGGTGRRIDTGLLGDFERRRLVLAGGLTPDNVAAAVRTVRPVAVDVAGGVERAPGVKDVTLMRRFIANAIAA